MRRLWIIVPLALAVLFCTCLLRAAPAVTPGYAINYYLSDIDGSYQPYGVYIPDPYRANKPHPVVLHMHGFGGRLGGFSPWQQEWADARGWILAYPDGRGNNNYDGIGEDDLFRVLDDLKARYRIDPDRVYVTGGSMGGHGSYRMPLRYPDVFTAGAPIAGWTDYREFYPHFYEQAAEPFLPDYVDPSRRPLLETASSLWQTENGRYNWLLIGYGTWDSINPPLNAERVVQRLREFGHHWHRARGDWGGHGAGHDVEEIYNYFEGKARVLRPKAPVYVTNTLKHNRAYWIRIDALAVNNRWSRLAATAEEDTIRVEAMNVHRYTLLPENSPADFSRHLTVFTNGLLTYQGIPGGPLTISARLDDRYRVVGWERADDPETTRPVKRHGLQGPISDAFLSRFVVTYGTAGSRAETERNRRDALRFCAEWNNWMILHWGGSDGSKNRRNNWWQPPYPFRPGPYIPEDQPLMLPIPDTQLSAAQIASANLVLFGDLKSHKVLRQIHQNLPLRLTENGIHVGGRAYTGRNVNYFFVAPNPLNRERYVVVSRGYLSSQIDPYEHSPSAVGKDLEALPFFWPDYVVWDAARKPGVSIQQPFVYLPECYLDAGYFNSEWSLDDDAPATTAFLSGEAVGDAYPAPVDIALVAEDHPGGFGVARSEYRLNGGPWTTYTEPLRVTAPGRYTLEYRSQDLCGQYVYTVTEGSNRGRSAPGNMEPVRRLSFTVND